ncbi:hypothetical protein MRB53_040372 [Persea americana]|nr:hypothetical protein MRB53_040372 [Persea americana]
MKRQAGGRQGGAGEHCQDSPKRGTAGLEGKCTLPELVWRRAMSLNARGWRLRKRGSQLESGQGRAVGNGFWRFRFAQGWQRSVLRPLDVRFGDDRKAVVISVLMAAWSQVAVEERDDARMIRVGRMIHTPLGSRSRGHPRRGMVYRRLDPSEAIRN